SEKCNPSQANSWVVCVRSWMSSSSDGGLAASQSHLASAHQCSFPEKLGGSGVAATRAWKVVGLRARRQAVQVSLWVCFQSAECRVGLVDLVKPEVVIESLEEYLQSLRRRSALRAVCPSRARAAPAEGRSPETG